MLGVSAYSFLSWEQLATFYQVQFQLFKVSRRTFIVKFLWVSLPLGHASQHHSIVCSVILMTSSCFASQHNLLNYIDDFTFMKFWLQIQGPRYCSNVTSLYRTVSSRTQLRSIQPLLILLLLFVYLLHFRLYWAIIYFSYHFCTYHMGLSLGGRRVQNYV